MSESSLGLTEGVSIALGGMIGGGIFAVLGVVAQLTRGATWLAFVLAGVVAACAAYSYNALNRITEERGGAVTFVQSFVGNTTLSGMTGWTLLLGYVGSMAMYAYAFGSFAVGLAAVPDAVFGVGLRPVLSVLAVAAFVGLNLAGAQATGAAENALVGAKVAILLAFAGGGIAFGLSKDALVYGTGRLASFGPVVAAGVSFVAFQGWQLLFYDQDRFEDPAETIPRAVYLSIAAAVVVYALVAVTTVSLAPLSVIRAHPERALAVAADPFVPHGFLLISLAALFSTGSAINATLFSAGHFTKSLLSNDLVPDRVGDASEAGVPRRTLLALGAVVAGFTAYGTLGAITAFASLTFVVVFGATSYLAFRQRDRSAVNPLPPALGAVGGVAFFFLMLRHLYLDERGTFVAVALLAVGVLAVETLYFEREVLAREVRSVGGVLDEETPGPDR